MVDAQATIEQFVKDKFYGEYLEGLKGNHNNINIKTAL